MRTRYTAAWALFAALVFCLCCTFAWAKSDDGPSGNQEAVRSGSGPKLVIKETDMNFGKVEQGKTLSHEFVISNEGTEPLKIISVKPG